MSTGDALLAAIRAAPDDDVPRLVYADWLDEHGDPEQAEFIRAQIAEYPSEYVTADQRSARLLAENAERWTEPYRPLLGDAPPELHTTWVGYGRRYGLTFERGFVEEVWTDCDSLLRCPPDALRRLTIPPRVVLIPRDDVHARWPFRDLVRSGVLRYLRAVTLWAMISGIRDADLQDLLAEPTFLAKLDGLQCEETSVTDATVIPILQSRLVNRLRYLNLSSTHCTSRVIGALLSGKRYLQIENLCWMSGPAGPSDVRRLCSPGGWPRLKKLELRWCQLDDWAAGFLVSLHLPSLTRLTLDDNQITDRGAMTLATSPNLPRLQVLTLSGNRLTADGLRAIRERVGSRPQVFVS